MKPLQRRKFIKQAFIAGAGTAVAANIHAQQAAGEAPILEDGEKSTAPPTGKKIIVAGAGITGLCCGYELMKAGHEVVILEATGRYGGHVYTGRDGLSDGLYADFGADHITKPGYERFFEYAEMFNLPVIAYPFAEGSDAAPNKHALRMRGGKFYTDEELYSPARLKQDGFNDKEIAVLANAARKDLQWYYLKPYLDKFKDAYQPFGIGYDDYDNTPIADIYKKEGASDAALRMLGGKHSNALYVLWRMAIMQMRGIPPNEGDTFHLKDGNEQLPMAFAKRLGERVRLNHPITSIAQTDKNVTVTYKPYGKDDEQEMSADYIVNCITLPVFKNIPVTPALSAEKQYVVDNLEYSSHPFYVFECATRFWLDDGFKSINMEFEHPDISSIWEETNHVDSKRIILKAYGPGGLSARRVLAAFREVYPGRHDTIEQALTKDWTVDTFAPACEMEPFAIGTMHKF
ncbi:MAG TPA: FAD-dependent oxidoreductase, partial [Chitinophagaceae bacterium]|nr:FAD-dependent oxidoreductase [Chitinophagaceae bacterium]